MENLLRAIENHAISDEVAGVITIPSRRGITQEWPQWMNPALRAALEKGGIDGLWTHQLEAAQSIRSGVHTVVATGTGSGKSLAAWIPALSLLSEGPSSSAGLGCVSYRPTVLYLSPTKALAADQFSSLVELARATDPRIGVAVVDGDADGPTRRWAREHANIVLTNPDFAQHVMLAGHRNWAHLWRGLSLVVIDEFHSYRGVFGAHVANTVRRILRVAAHYGATPTVVFLSATSGNPAQTAERFLGPSFGPVHAVDDDHSPRGSKKLVLWRGRDLEPAPSRTHVPAEVNVPSEAPAQGADPDADLTSSDSPRRAANTEAGELTGVLAANGAQTLTFVRSRPGAERVAMVAQDWLAEHQPALEDAVATYRGGYLPEDRRELESRLRSGDLRALASTNALELGIDISGLDAVIVTGWPGTHASFAQQIGRAGRAGQDGLAVFVGRDNPLDQYLLNHPEVIEEAKAETNVFDPLNPYVLIPHICAAASELPLTEHDAAIFGLEGTSLFDDLVSDGLLRKRPNGWYWDTAMGVNPHEGVNLRGEGSTVSIVESDTGTILGTVDSARADTTVFPGALYLHQSVPYMVDELHEDVALVHLHREEEIRTYASENTSVRILSAHEQIRTGIGIWARGEVLVTSQVDGYDIRRSADGMYLGRVPLSMPLRQLHTAGTWWTISSEAIREAGINASELPGALHAAEHTAIGILPLFATCDRWDLGGLSTVHHEDTGEATIFVHDAIAGGSGCAERGFSSGIQWMRATLQALLECGCTSGCPRCVQSPKCGNNNSPLSKEGAIRLLSTLLDHGASLPSAGPATARAE